ncbi:MAG TPA: LD-carboxypeptidase [Bacillota bacterium]|nr:LD-carboxypeptidase [Bacillota bacterium]HPL53107.1 LD-carboxypeptidase [Bacillota bacterium]
MKAKRLKIGDTIGMVAPASPSDSSKVEKAVKYLNNLGYIVKAGKSVFSSRGYLAGGDELRAFDINNMFEDDEVNAVFCLRGGYGSQRILDLIDFQLIRKNPKIFMGYSDITALLNAIYQKCGLITFHGPMGGDFAGGLGKQTKRAMKNALESTEPIGEIPNPEIPEIVAEGKGKGALVGGNLSIVAASLGTPYEINTQGCVLLLEDVFEEPYSVDRMLTQLRLAGKFKDVSGIILGDWGNLEPEEPEKSLSFEEVFKDIFEDIGKPVIKGLKIGHCKPNITVPIGAEVSIDTDTVTLCVLESAVK